MVGSKGSTRRPAVGSGAKQPQARGRSKQSKEQLAEVAAPQAHGVARRSSHGDELAKRLGELRDVCRWLVELAESPNEGRLGARGMGIVDMFKALRTVWPEPYVSKYERKLLEAIDARDEPRMAQALLDFIVYNGVKELQDRTERLRSAQRRGALISAEKKRGRPSSGELRLNEYRKNTKTEPTKATKVLADKVSLSPSRLRWLLRHKR